jgi:hypothetical protein
MGTRTIVTSQPDVTCYVCERRLLRGEQPEIFLADGRPRTVCELCAPRAAHQGWLREADGDSLRVAQVPARRGRNLLGRLLQFGRPANPPRAVGEPSASFDGEREPYDFLGGSGQVAAEPARAHAEPLRAGAGQRSEAQPSLPVTAAPTQRSPSYSPPAGPIAVTEDELLERAVEAFNAGEYPRRVAGLIRSLGRPGVNVRPYEYSASVVAIVVAWELCWYRYRVDFDEQAFHVSVTAQGTELEELARADLLANAAADELGALSLTGVQA